MVEERRLGVGIVKEVETKVGEKTDIYIVPIQQRREGEDRP